MNKLFQQLLQQARRRVPQATRAAQGFAEELVAPAARPTASSLRPSPTAAAFPLDDVLTRFGARARYLQRQAQTTLETGVGQIGGIYRNLQGMGPTALNPLATRTPTTLLGKVGKFFNPLNPANASGLGASLLIDNLLPEGQFKRDLGTTLYTPGNPYVKATSAILLSTPNAGVSDEKEAELIRQSLARGSGKLGPPVPQNLRSAPPGDASPPPAQNLLPPALSPVPSGGTPQERADAQERSRVAQLTEQDPLFKKYRIAELSKAYNAAKGDEKEKLGLEIWATTNPQLAQKLKPGQLGYTEATSAFMSQSPLGSIAKAAGDMQFANKFTPDQMSSIPFETTLQTPLTNIQFNAPNQIGVSEAFNTGLVEPGDLTSKFTDTLNLFAPEKTSQLQQALIKQAFNQRLK